jgi:adenylate cyclase
MGFRVNGELVPAGGGDNIPLIRPVLTIGRRDSCDICLRFPNISGLHAELAFREGYWYLRDCNSTNGVKVNSVRILEKRLNPKDKVTIGKRDYTIEYELPAGHDPALDDNLEEDIMSQSLLERAGLEKPREEPRPSQRGPSAKGAHSRPGKTSDREFDPARFLLDE